MIRTLFRRRKPRPTTEALLARAELEAIRPHAHALVRERDRLLGENNYTARIRALYQGEA